MTKAFTKGQAVTIIRKWSKDCTAYAVKAVVYSCGTKQMVLTCATTGAELGRNFKPAAEQLGRGVVINGHDAADIEVAALAVSQANIDWELAHYERITTNAAFPTQSSAYREAINKEYAEAKTFTPKFIMK